MRGKHLSRVWAERRNGITPADAGKTQRDLRWGVQNGDHPRGCGENCTPVMVERCPSGSPPRMRGKPIAVMISGSAPRITPADAGKTAGMTKEQVLQEGSPPRMRGKLFERYILGNWVRITPADAGKTV